MVPSSKTLATAKAAGRKPVQAASAAKAWPSAPAKASSAANLVADMDDFSPLGATDPRWAGKMRAKALAKPSPETAVAAYASDTDADRKDRSKTGAIPAISPQWPITTEGAEPGDDAADTSSAGKPGRIYTGANLRAKPGGRVISTVPARSDVRVISCNSWCEIVYKGRHGFVYKSFLSGNTRTAVTRRRAADPAVANAATGTADASGEISAVKPPPRAEIKTIDVPRGSNR